ncbi:MAG: hypothetical protein MUO38_13745, partial [Anaerolineales bacterium]|nr:hypothetical protein [Anaerolineales bacterium]
MNAFYQNTREAEPKRWLGILLAMLGASAVVAVFQSVKFSSSLWVVTEFGFVYWQEHITRMLSSLVPWAAVTGVIFALQFMAPETTTQASMLLRSGAVGFFSGFLITYLLVAVLGIAIYPALGILSFIFPDQVAFGSLGFAVLCSMYIVFLVIATDTPPLLLEVVRKAPLYFKLLGVLLAALLAVQVLSSVVGGLIIMVEHSTWRVHLPAFAIAFGGTLLVTVFLNLAILKEGPPAAKVLRIVSAFVLAIIAGNMSEAVLHWGEYASALVAAVPGSAAASALVLGVQKSPAKASLLIAGL